MGAHPHHFFLRVSLPGKFYMLACVWSCSCCVLVVYIFWLLRWPGPLQNLCPDLFKLICTSFVIGLGTLFTYLTNCKEPLKKCRLPHIKVTEINGYIIGKHAVVMGQADIEFGPSSFSKHWKKSLFLFSSFPDSLSHLTLPSISTPSSTPWS